MSKPVQVVIDGLACTCEVADRLGWMPAAGVYAIEVIVPGGAKRIAVRPSIRSVWRLWTVEDRLGVGSKGGES